MNPDGSLKEWAQKDYDEEASKLKTLHDDYKKKYAKEASAGKEYTKAKDKFMKTPLGVAKQAGDTIKAGRKKVAGILRKLADFVD